MNDGDSKNDWCQSTNDMPRIYVKVIVHGWWW